MLKILIYSYNYHPEPIGIAPLITELAEGLAQRGHRVRVVTGMPNYPERQIYPAYRGKWYLTELLNGVQVQRSYIWVRPNPGLLGRILLDGSFVVTSLLQALWGWKPQVILYTSPPLPVSVPAVLLGKWWRVPVVLNLQDILPEAAVHVGLLRNAKAIKVFEGLERFAYQFSTRVSVITEKFTENLVAKGVPPQKIVSIPNWVDVNFIRPLPTHPNSFRQAYGLQNRFVVLYAGNIALTQGLETVVEAAWLLRDTPTIVFVVVGEMKALKKLRQYCLYRRSQSETDDRPSPTTPDQPDVPGDSPAPPMGFPPWGQPVGNLYFIPFQPREVLPEMLAAANVGLIVQRHNVVSFNMPSKTQLLLASGRPIVASVPAMGSAAQVVTQSQGGLVVEPENPPQLAAAITQLYHDRPQAERMGQQGRQFALENYSFEKAIQAYERLFETLVQGRSPTAPS